MEKLKLGILASGNGSNLGAIINNINEGKLNAEIAVVISDNPKAYALTRAKEANINAVYIDPGEFKTKLTPETEAAYIKVLKENNVDIVCLAGFMRIIKEEFLNAFPNKIINIHPALLPAFPGLNVQKQAIDYGVKFSGCTVHYVDGGIDQGPIIMQAVVPICDTDTAEDLAGKILKEEHKIYSESIQLIAEDKIRIEGRKIITN